MKPGTRAGQERLRAGAERGSNTVTSMGLACLLLLLGVTVAGLIGVVTANHRAATAADLAALAAADTARGLRSGDACAVAGQVAAENQAQLTGCAPHTSTPGVVDVRLEVAITGPFSFLGSAEGLARAGPPGLGGSP
ncbi:MAG: hypothetical protein Q3965_03495 [Rothia sp. (in: high G+C Gram-positive bacteria)]|nr:hypothetical protein [Rothia sp. (in: high G+C Gram-positive bacteria)]